MPPPQSTIRLGSPGITGEYAKSLWTTRRMSWRTVEWRHADMIRSPCRPQNATLPGS